MFKKSKKFNLFDNILEPPINRNKMNRIIDNFKCDFPMVGENINIIIDDTCTARKDYDENGEPIRYTVFTMTCDSKESLELSMLIKSNMWALMSQYLQPYINEFGLKVDLNDRITNTEVRSDLIFPYVKGLVSNLRKYVHIAYFLAKKEVRGQYKAKVIKTLSKRKSSKAS